MGKLLSCGCDPSNYRGRPPAKARGTQWKWGGCSHNLDYGIEFSKQFLDSREKAGDIQSTVNLHNNQAGRLVRNHFSLFFLHIHQILTHSEHFEVNLKVSRICTPKGFRNRRIHFSILNDVFSSFGVALEVKTVRKETRIEKGNGIKDQKQKKRVERGKKETNKKREKGGYTLLLSFSPSCSLFLFLFLSPRSLLPRCY